MIPAAEPLWTSPVISFKIFENYEIPAATDIYILIKTDLVSLPAANYNSI